MIHHEITRFFTFLSKKDIKTYFLYIIIYLLMEKYNRNLYIYLTFLLLIIMHVTFVNSCIRFNSDRIRTNLDNIRMYLILQLCVPGTEWDQLLRVEL